MANVEIIFHPAIIARHFVVFFYEHHSLMVRMLKIVLLSHLFYIVGMMILYKVLDFKIITLIPN